MDEESSENNRKKSKYNREIDDFELELEKVLLEAEDDQCTHSIRLGNLCCNCGKEIKTTNNLVNVAHNSDKILQTFEDAYKMHLEHFYELSKNKKLILLCDLDQTLIHATMDESDCDFKFTIDSISFYVKKRPGLNRFLSKLNELFELHVYTMGSRSYADKICENIDPNKKYFGDRIISRTENNNELKKYIKRIFSFEKHVLALDDRVDVWDFIGNVIAIKPFCYYNITDINDPGKINSNTFIDQSLADLSEEVKNEIVKNVKDEFDELTVKETNISDKAVVKDVELKGVYNELRKIHKKYFMKLNKIMANKQIEDVDVDKITDVSDIARSKIFRGKYFICKSGYTKIIRFLGGKVIKPADFDFYKDVGSVYVINDIKTASKYKIESLDDFWLIECLHSRKFVDTKLFIQKY